jgi:PmbA protein
VSGPLESVLAALTGREGAGVAEVYWKRGRSRRLERDGLETASSYQREEGWAVRAGDDRGSFFLAGTGQPRPEGPWPAPDGRPLELPSRRSVGEPAPWREPPELDAPLVGEKEGFALLTAIEEELARESPGARLLSARLDDGGSEVELANSLGISARHRLRAAHLRVEAIDRADGEPRVAVVEVGLQEARQLDPKSVARRLADRLHVLRLGQPVERDRADLLLAPAVSARLMASLLPLLVGPEAQQLAERLGGSRDRFGSEAVTIVDDGRRDGGLLAAPTDGEGVPTRSVTLVERGTYHQPLLGPRDAPTGRGARLAGHARRASWRDQPETGPSHLSLQPGTMGVGRLVGGLTRGYFLIALEGAPRVDFKEGRLSFPAAGFAVEAGRAREPVKNTWVTGTIASFLRGIVALGRDLQFEPFALGGMIGAPTLLVTGLELRGSP